MVILTSVMAHGILTGGATLPLVGRSVLIAACATCVAQLLTPAIGSNLADWVRNSVLWSALCGLAAVCVMAVTLPGLQPTMFALGGAVAVLVLMITSAVWLCATWFGGEQAKLVVFSLLMLASSTPLWLGPVASHADSQYLTNAIVGVSPVSYFAAVADYDYLRTNWFYQYTPYGGIRYEYPSAVISTTVYQLLTICLVGLRQWLSCSLGNSHCGFRNESSQPSSRRRS